MSSYFNQMLPVAQYVSSKTGINTSVLLAQMAHETGYGASKGAKERNNHAGLSWFKSTLPSWSKAIKLDNRPANEGGSYMNYKTVWDFADDYVRYLKNGYYDNVIKAKTTEEQVKALGASPWAATHYVGTGKYNYQGGNIQAIIDQHNLKSYDGVIVAKNTDLINLGVNKNDLTKIVVDNKTMIIVVGATALLLAAIIE